MSKSNKLQGEGFDYYGESAFFDEYGYREDPMTLEEQEAWLRAVASDPYEPDKHEDTDGFSMWDSEPVDLPPDDTGSET